MRPVLLLLAGLTCCTLVSSTTQEEQEWYNFKSWHILDPDEFPKYSSWKARTWQNWFLRRRSNCVDMKTTPSPAISGPPSQNLRHAKSHNRTAILKCLKHTEVILVSRPEQVLAAFSAPLLQYGVKRQAMVWSSSPFQAYVFEKAGKRLIVYDCGLLYIAGRLHNSYPVTLHDFYPSQIRNPLGGYLRYPVSRNCQRLTHGA